MASWNRLDKETQKDLRKKFEKILEKISGDKKLKYPNGYYETMWLMVKKNIKKMKDDTIKINRLYETIQREIRAMNEKYMEKQYDLIDDLYVQFHLGTDILNVQRDDLTSFFYFNRALLPSYWGSEKIGTKLKSTYNYFKDKEEATSAKDKLFRIKAYYNIFAVYPYGRKYIFEDAQLTIFPPEYEMNYNYNYNKKRPYDGSGSDGGNTSRKTKRRYGGYGSDDGESTTTTTTTTTTINTNTIDNVLKF